MSIIMSIIIKSQEEHLKLIFPSHRSTMTLPILIIRERLKLDFRPHYFNIALLKVLSRTLNGCFKISTCSYVS